MNDIIPPEIEIIDKPNKKKEKGNYCFPDFLAKIMKSVSPRIQYEASLLSMTFILIGLFVFGSYLIFFTQLSLFAKILVAVNIVAGFIFLSSFLITTFQQYQIYLAVMGVIDDENN